MTEPACPRCGYDPVASAQRRTLLVVLDRRTREEVQICAHCHAPGELVIRVK